GIRYFHVTGVQTCALPICLSDLAPEIVFDNPWEDTHPLRLVHVLEHTTGWSDLSLAEFAYQAPDTMGLKEALDYRPATRKSRWEDRKIVVQGKRNIRGTR